MRRWHAGVALVPTRETQTRTQVLEEMRGELRDFGRQFARLKACALENAAQLEMENARAFAKLQVQSSKGVADARREGEAAVDGRAVTKLQGAFKVGAVRSVERGCS